MKKLISTLFITVMLVSAAISAFALDSHYKNNLLNVELTQMPDNRVSVLLVFEKPYTDAIKVVYKTDNEYNILLPETYHSMTSVSAINALNVRSANVKLVPYFNQDTSNGYTKITIKTTRPVIFNAHSSYVTSKLAKEDTLLEKLNKDESLKIKPTTLPQKSSAKKTSSKPAVKRPAPKKPAKQTIQTAKRTYKKPAAVKPKPIKKSVQKTAPKPAVKVQTKPIQQQTPKAVPVSPQATVEPTPVVPITPVQPKVEPKIPTPEAVSFPQNIINKIQQYTNTKYGLAAVLGILTLLILGMLLKLFNKTTQNYANLYNRKVRNFENEESVELPDDLKNLENLTWQEKYKLMKQREEEAQAADISAQEKDRLDKIDKIYSETEPVQASSLPETNMFASALSQPLDMPSSDDIIDKEPASFDTLETLDDLSDISPEIEGAVSPENLYDNEPQIDIDIEEPQSVYMTKPVPAEPVLLNQAKISKTKGFYLIRYENEAALVGYIKDKIFLLQTFNSIDQTFVQTRLTEKKRGEDIYLVRSDNYKALVRVSKDEMKTLIKL